MSSVIKIQLKPDSRQMTRISHEIQVANELPHVGTGSKSGGTVKYVDHIYQPDAITKRNHSRIPYLRIQILKALGVEEAMV